LGWPLGRVGKKRRKKERERKKEEMAISAKIRLNFEKCKILVKWW
jgi:hypothetical protein